MLQQIVELDVEAKFSPANNAIDQLRNEIQDVVDSKRDGCSLVLSIFKRAILKTSLNV